MLSLVAEEVADMLEGKLPSTALFRGFDNETAMVQELQQADSASDPQCFIKGAGEWWVWSKEGVAMVAICRYCV